MIKTDVGQFMPIRILFLTSIQDLASHRVAERKPVVGKYVVNPF